ncbi:MAG: hypothetical protein EBY17_28000 [Acidobacteriia bacterium]|jgi:hypothetical protein|nr:hypothetical protein [Terriglobia bacterium]
MVTARLIHANLQHKRGLQGVTRFGLPLLSLEAWVNGGVPGAIEKLGLCGGTTSEFSPRLGNIRASTASVFASILAV